MSGKKIVMVLAPPRSGSSFTASWLARCGLDLGRNLKPADDIMNEKGFYEDMDLFTFHEKIVKRYRRERGFFRRLLGALYIKGNTVSLFDPLAIKEDDFAAATKLVDKFDKSQEGDWGWKLSFVSYHWNTLWWPVFKKMELEKNMALLILVRDFKKMVDSTIRSELLYLQKEKNPWHGLKAFRYRSTINERANFWLKDWINCYSEILLFLKQNPSFTQYLVVDVPTILGESERVYKQLTEMFGLSLTYVNPNEFYERALMDRRLSIDYTLDTALVHEATTIYARLMAFIKEQREQAIA